jgi:hypothetical protein
MHPDDVTVRNLKDLAPNALPTPSDIRALLSRRFEGPAFLTCACHRADCASCQPPHGNGWMPDSRYTDRNDL